MLLARAVADRGPNGEELRRVSGRAEAAHLEPNADHSICAEGGGLLLHPLHGELACMVERPGQHLELLVADQPPALKADVVDRRAEHEAERLEARVLDEQVLVDGKVGSEDAGLALAETVATALRYALERIARLRHRSGP